MRNLAGVEYSGQFLCDPAKLEHLRLNALRVVAGFPKTLPGLAALGYADAERILRTPITDAATISDFVDSIWNSCVPLPASTHTGVLSGHNPTNAGAHHYPAPLVDLQFLKWDDFILWHIDPVAGTPVAVTPTAPRGSGVATVKVEFAQEGTELHDAHMAAREKGEALVLPADHPIAQAAFQHQS